MKLRAENSKHLELDIDEQLYDDLDLLAGRIKYLRDKIVIDLIVKELEKQKYVIDRLRDIERRKQNHVEMLGEQYIKESEKDDKLLPVYSKESERK